MKWQFWPIRSLHCMLCCSDSKLKWWIHVSSWITRCDVNFAASRGIVQEVLLKLVHSSGVSIHTHLTDTLLIHWNAQNIHSPKVLLCMSCCYYNKQQNYVRPRTFWSGLVLSPKVTWHHAAQIMLLFNTEKLCDALYLFRSFQCCLDVRYTCAVFSWVLSGLSVGHVFLVTSSHSCTVMRNYEFSGMVCNLVISALWFLLTMSSHFLEWAV